LIPAFEAPYPADGIGRCSIRPKLETPVAMTKNLGCGAAASSG
jgi:hypothetical protein